MRDFHQRPTLLIFTRGVERETRRRRLLPTRLAPLERILHRRCLASALAAGQEAGCEITISSPAPVADALGCRRLPQEGDSFGCRLRAAMATTYRQAAGPVVVVGTDVPSLGSHHLRAALSKLEMSPSSVVIGPSQDGGFYLLASNRSLDELLAGVSWNRRETLRSLLSALAGAGIEVSLLEPLVDLDRPQDLTFWVNHGSRAEIWRALVGLLRWALAVLARPTIPLALGRPRGLLATSPTGRAPPLPA